MENSFVNKVELSGIITVDLIDFEPVEKALTLDIKDFLFMEMIVREKEFKELLETYDWTQFIRKPVAIGCSVDTIVPTWAYMMLAKYLECFASKIDYCDAETLNLYLWKENISRADFSRLKGKKVVVRARHNIDPSLYLLITERLKPLVGTLLYGEAGLPKVIHKNK